MLPCRLVNLLSCQFVVLSSCNPRNCQAIIRGRYPTSEMGVLHAHALIAPGQCLNGRRPSIVARTYRFRDDRAQHESNDDTASNCFFRDETEIEHSPTWKTTEYQFSVRVRVGTCSRGLKGPMRLAPRECGGRREANARGGAKGGAIDVAVR
jgi:hypothetical protein